MIAEFLTANREKLLSGWTDAILATYPKTRIKFRKGADPFSNPIGHVLHRDLPVLLDQVMGEGEFDVEVIRTHLDPLCRIRSVQEFSPSESVGLILLLKKVLLESLPASIWADSAAVGEWLVLDARIDRLVLYAVDLYADCREALAQVRINEATRRSDIIVNKFAREGRGAFAKPAGPDAGENPAESNGHGGSGV